EDTLSSLSHEQLRELERSVRKIQNEKGPALHVAPNPSVSSLLRGSSHQSPSTLAAQSKAPNMSNLLFDDSRLNYASPLAAHALQRQSAFRYSSALGNH